MSRICVYREEDGCWKSQPLTMARVERDIQNLVENHMEVYFGVRFLQSEWDIGCGRMDSIGIDENNRPVIFEFKRNQDSGVILQGLSYLDWLLDHKDAFKSLVHEKLGQDYPISDCSDPVVYCVAYEFSRFDTKALNQIGKNIQLIKYKLLGNDMIIFEFVNEFNCITKNSKSSFGWSSNEDGTTHELDNYGAECDCKRIIKKIDNLPQETRKLYNIVCDIIEQFNLERNVTINYIAYKNIKNVVCISADKKHVYVYPKLEIENDRLNDYIEDVSSINGEPGRFRITITDETQIEQVRDIIERACSQSI